MLGLITYALSAAKKATTNYLAPDERRHVPYLFRYWPRRRTFARKWNYGLTHAAREENPGVFTTWKPNAHSIRQYVLVVTILVTLMMNVLRNSSVITAARTTWVSTVQLGLDMPMRLWRTNKLTFSVTVTGSLWIM